MDMKRPSAGESFFPKLMLEHRAARSYEELRFIDGKQYETFGEATLALNLISRDSEASQCMNEAVTNLRSPGQLRTLFVLLLNEGAAGKPLFEEFEDAMAQDFIFNNHVSLERAKVVSLKDITSKIDALGKLNSDFGLPMSLELSTEVERMREKYDRVSCGVEYAKMEGKLNQEQREFVQCVQLKLNEKNGGAIFLNGQAGRGKTFVTVALLNLVRSTGSIALCCASAAIAATHYPGGRTAHNLFKIPVKEDPAELTEIQCDIPFSSERAETLRQASLVVWDEFPMMHRINVEAVDKMLRTIRRKSTLFGGLLFVCVGDFRQIPPVVRNGTKRDTIDASIRSSVLWKHFVTFTLVTPVRQLEDLEYAK